MTMQIQSKPFAELVGFPANLGAPAKASKIQDTHGTTVLAIRYKDGILNLGDRRATSANFILYDKAEKVLPLDEYTLVGISGSFARSIEIVRYLKHAFKYYARTQLQDMSVEGKLQEVSRALAGNLSMSLDGIGVFIPIVSAYNPVQDTFGIYFYDVLGARFESGEFASAGSGSERIRGIFDYISRQKGPFDSRGLDDVLADGLQMLEIAAQLDSATGGLERVPPIAKVLTRSGIQPVPEKSLTKAIKQVGGK
jgi:proteasome beta subunit